MPVIFPATVIIEVADDEELEMLLNCLVKDMPPGLRLQVLQQPMPMPADDALKKTNK